MTRYLIIGNGIAANTAAERIRTIDPSGIIHMFTKESVPFYYTPALPEVLSGEKDLQSITIHDEVWYERNNIVLHRATPILKIDPALQEVTAQDGATYVYDRLLLATGGNSFVPPIQGADRDGVFTLRTFADAKAIKERATRAKTLVLIGGGLLGLEAGNGLRKAGLSVIVVEFFPRLLPRQMDPAGASILQRQMEGMGFSFYLNARTKEIAERNGCLEVRLEDGIAIPADMVLISAGVRPDLSLPKSVGIDCDKAVKVDDAMKTNIQNIFAAGDLVEHRGIYYGIWPAAMEQGAVAGTVMAGQEAQYTGTVISNTLKVVGIQLTAAGDIDPDGTRESIVRSDPVRGIYRKLVISNNTITGAILFGDVRGSDAILQAMKNKTDISRVKSFLNDETFDFSELRS
ncbi:MAG: FAD-dependent oxidoreductase [Desulfobacterota bacterium]|nr:FAD-dependent oxidoreductase [Thermodesulfobacteriota bacterium]